LLILCLSSLAAATACESSPLQYSFTIWDWEETYRDFGKFQKQVDTTCEHGFNLLELGASWADCEPTEGQYDFSHVDQRVAYASKKGLAIRLRLNMVARPSWYHAELYQFPDGTVFTHGGGYPSVFNEINRQKQLAFAEALARHFSGKGFTYTPGFSLHMEIKFGDWNTYEPSARSSFRTWLAGRYDTVENLNSNWGTSYTHFGEIEPPIPQSTSGKPVLSPAERDWILFREQALANWVTAFAASIRRADPTAKISVPLGESFRRQSAAFANLGYWTYSRQADEVVHSYDFFWHGTAQLKAVRASLATMIGITQKPTLLEIDGPYLLSHYGYTPNHLVEAADNALATGAAGIQISNWGSTDLSKETWMSTVAELIRSHEKHANKPCSSPQILYYVSKWQQYAFRENEDWVYERQFTFWHRLQEACLNVRIVSDENVMNETLFADYLLLPFDIVIDEPVRERLRALSYGMKAIADEKPGIFTPTQKTAGNFGAKMTVTGTPFAEDPRNVQEILGAPPADRLRAAVVQFRSSASIRDNLQRMLVYLENAARDGARVVVFPEMALTGYTKHKAFRERLDWKQINGAIEDISEACRNHNIYAVFGAPSRSGSRIFCAAYAIAPDGKIIDRYEKIYLAGEEWASPGRHLSLFSIDGTPCGTIICHDERYPPLIQLRALAGARLFFYISCESGIEQEYKLEPYRAQIQARAVENGVYILHANTPAVNSANDGADGSHGQSRIVAPDGNILDELDIEKEGMLIRDLLLSYAKPHGLDKALYDGPLARWMKKGLHLVQDIRKQTPPDDKD